MIVLHFNNLKILNVSLQVGDAVYARGTTTQAGAEDLETGPGGATGSNHLIGILRRIDTLSNGKFDLYVDDVAVGFTGDIDKNEFIMFSKYDQTDGDILGYYAEAKFVNDSKKKAELYMVSSEVVINSK